MSSSLTILSAILFIAGLSIYKKSNPTTVSMGLFFIMTFGSLLLFVIYSVANYFTGHGIDEATIYHLKYGLEGAGYLEYSWFIAVTISALILGVIYSLWIISKSSNNRSSRLYIGLSSYSLMSISLIINPASINIYNLQANSLIPTQQSNSRISTDFFGILH